MRKLLPRRRERDALRGRIAEVADARGRLDERVAAQQDELDDLRARVRARLAVAENERGGAPFEPAVADEEVELELLRRARPEEA